MLATQSLSPSTSIKGAVFFSYSVLLYGFLCILVNAGHTAFGLIHFWLFFYHMLMLISPRFGHQDKITAIDSLSRERCVTAGGRDASVRIWKILEESQLVFNAHTM